ncbi:ABC transporter substrate-binding protein [Luteipulveratus mongoliensis]|uniref:LacI family transcriptional regulator n=1 Tax=Luteipulveratus mongoliensis TaxID=571913 RepID=A0A0K1JGB2_9MICO|nr:ABC transporter substrate-binding protein [Luteipulveratus mongoliensis]AKU15645.1 LacI family transcriptional regulator [Luteipulveratus mongoliensis]
MRSSRFGAAVAIVAAVSLTAACGFESDDSSTSSAGGGTSKPAAGEKPYIAIVSKGFQHQFWQAVKKGAETEAAKQGARITFEGPPTEQDVEGQMTMLTNALAKKPAALGFAALDSKAAAGALKDAKAKNIPVIAFDSGVEGDIPLTTAATNNKAAAAEAAKRMAALIGNKGTVGLVVHDQTSVTGQDRRDGFLDWMKANAPGIKVLPVQYGAGDPAKSADITKSIISSHPDIAGIYGANEGSAVGVIKGVQESGKKNIKVVGFDSGQAQLTAIGNGTEAGAITQNPVGIGQQVVRAAMKAIKGETLPKTIDTGYYWYDKTNITDPKIQAVLYK